MSELDNKSILIDAIREVTEELIKLQILYTKETKKELKELTYFKQTIEFESGVYLLSFIHVEGQKIELIKDEA